MPECFSGPAHWSGICFYIGPRLKHSGTTVIYRTNIKVAIKYGELSVRTHLDEQPTLVYESQAISY
ncbi:hypothetical protein AB4542_03675, partial [Vibrio breoganii]